MQRTRWLATLALISFVPISGVDRLANATESVGLKDLLDHPREDLSRQRNTLEALAGQYQLGLQSVTVAVRNESALTLTLPGKPSYELVPSHNLTFDVKGLDGFSISFRKDASDVASELIFRQPNGTFVAKRKPAASGAIAPTRQADPPASRPQASGKSPPDKSPTAWSPELMMQVRRVGPVRVSPDGKRVAYQVSSATMNDTQSEYVSQIFLAHADGSHTIQMTFGEKSSGDPQWSPNSKSLAFTSRRAGKNNLYLIPIDGGEAIQLTDLKSDVTFFQWSPTGNFIAFVMADPPSESEVTAQKSMSDARWYERDWKFARLYVIPVQPGARPVANPRLLTPANYHVGTTSRTADAAFHWSPDSRSIVFSHQKTPKANDWTTSDVSVVDLSSGQVKDLAATAASETRPIYSPDGRWIAMSVSEIPPRWGGSRRIQVVAMSGEGEPRALPETFDGQPNLIGWSTTSSQIYFAEARGTVDRIYSIDVRTGEISDYSAGNQVFTSVDLNSTGTAFGLAMESSHEASEAYVSRVEKFEPVVVSRAQKSLAKLPLGNVEIVRWKSTEGMEIEGLLIYPVGYEKGKRVPMLLNIHGGPMGVFSQRFIAQAGLYPIAAFAVRGYAILQPNPRGSSGYGSKFRAANYQDWGGGDYLDLMAGVDHVVAMGVADPDRLGVMGWSYGGYMSSWVITQTRRFKAASIGAPVTNLVSFNGTADIPNFLPDYLGSQPWEDLELYRSRSPVLQAHGVTTPALIQHGDADVRVPISQGYEFYNALRQRGVPAEMLVLPRQPHGPTEPKMIRKVMETNLDWFEKHLGKAE